jgi:hypothetical protein
MSDSNLPSVPKKDAAAPIQTATSILTVRNTALKPLYYTARVTSTNPCAFVLLLDHSISMDESIEDNRGMSKRKAELLADQVNKFLEEVILTCRKTDLIKEYFEILIISYGKVDEIGDSVASIAWEGSLEGKSWVTVNELRQSALRKEIREVPNNKRFGPKVIKEEVNVWMEPFAEGLTPMKAAFEMCNSYTLLSD